jgi:hypothetical protein
MMIMFFKEFAFVRQVLGDFVRRKGVYALVHDQPSTKSTTQLSTKVEFYADVVELVDTLP